MARGKKKSLKSYLRDYARYMTDSENYKMSSYIKNLNKTDKNARAETFVFLYGLTFRDKEFFIKLFTEDQQERFKEMIKERNKYKSLENYMRKQKGDIEKILEVYENLKRKESADGNHKKIARESIIKEMKNKKINIYELSKNTGINSGNLYRFINKKDYKALSFEMAEKAFDYLTK